MSRLLQQKGEIFLEPQLSVFESLSALSDARTAESLLALNGRTEEYGLRLAPEDAWSLAQARRDALEASGRVEFGKSALEGIILCFSRSKYLYQYDYATVLHELLEVFYLLKNETRDRISDAELTDFLFDCFENRYRGSLELFRGRELEKLRRTLLGLGESEDNGAEREEDSDDE